MGGRTDAWINEY